MSIGCSEKDCIYYRDGECGLTLACSPGEYKSAACAYFVKRAHTTKTACEDGSSHAGKNMETL